MKNLSAIIFLSIFLMMSCSKKDMENSEVTVISAVEELDAIMDNCRNSELTSREEIEDNLIGEWKLIGIRSGWNNTFILKDITLTIDQNKIVLNDQTSGETSETDWSLKFVEVNSFEYFYLETNEETFNNRIGMETFCQDFMFGSGRVDDASFYIYEKLNK